MKLKEAQDLSPLKVAVWGNVAMKDIIWPMDFSHPLLWVKNGYSLCTYLKDKYIDSDLWEPLKEIDWKLKLYHKNGD